MQHVVADQRQGPHSRALRLRESGRRGAVVAASGSSPDSLDLGPEHGDLASKVVSQLDVYDGDRWVAKCETGGLVHITQHPLR